MTLYNRQYTITVALPGTSLGVQITGLKCVFSVKKNLKGTPNTVNLKIWNLSEVTRKAIQALPTCTVQIDAGYLDQVSTIFLGDVRTHSTTIENDTDWVTEMAAGDGEKAIQHARVSVSLRKGSSIQQVLTTLVAALGVDPGNTAQAVAQLAPYGSMFTMGTVLSGSASREMTRVLSSVGMNWSVQNGKLQILKIAAVVAGGALLLTPQSGLIGSPSIDKDGFLNCKVLMIPDTFPGRLCIIQSANVTGQFRIEETEHTGDTHSETDWDISIKAKAY